MQQPVSQRSFFKEYLPTFDLAFVGRQTELVTLASALETHAYITIVGPGGIGKTRLAVQATLDMGHNFREGVIFVPLAAAVSRDAFITTLVTVLHLQFGAKEDMFDRVIAWLDRRNMLLVLDNVEPLMDHIELISRLLQVNGPKWIVTSRERLGLPNEIVLNLRGLPQFEERFDVHNELPPAERLFVQSMRKINPRFDPTPQDIDYIHRICRLTEGMPLAIELAASWTRLLPVSFVANQIAENLDWLTSSMSISRGPQRSIRAVLEYFWDLLSIEEQSHLCQLAVFQGGFEREMAEAFASVSFFFLSALVQHAFLSRIASGRYQLHELLRQYAIDRLNHQPDIASQTYRRYALFMRDWVKHRPAPDSRTQPTERQAWLNRMQTELPNLRGALNWAAEAGQFTLLLDIVLDLESLWVSLANYVELCEWIDLALQSGDRLSAQQRMAASLLAGQFAETISQFERAAQYAQQALSEAQTLDLAHPTVAAQRLLCIAMYRQGHFESAERYANDALLVAQRVEDARLMAQALRSLGMVLSARGNLVQALKYEQESLNIARQLDNPQDTASSLNAAAIDMAWLGQHDEAIRYLQESLAIHRSLNHLDHQSVSLMNLGWLYHLKQEPLKAEAYYQQALDILARTGDLDGLALTCLNIGDSMLDRAAPIHEVAAQYRLGLETAQRIQAWPTVMYGLIDTAKVALSISDGQQAALFLGIVVSHPSANETARTDALPLLDTLHQRYPKTQVTAWVETGKAHSLDEGIASALQLLERAN